MQALMDLFGRSRDALKHAKAQEKDAPVTLRDPDAYEFLPPVIALREQPASGAGKLVIRVMAVAVASFALWSWLGKLELVAVAPGKVVGVARTQTVQAPELAVVRAIKVAEGQRVKKGDVLIELDTAVVESSLEQAKTAMHAAMALAARHQSMLSSLKAGRFVGPEFDPRVPAAMVQAEMQVAKANFDDLQARLTQLDAEISLRDAQIESSRALLAKADAMSGLAHRRAEDLNALGREGFVSSHAVQDQEREKISFELDSKHLTARTEESRKVLAEARTRRVALQTEATRQASAGFADAMRQARLYEADVSKSTALGRRLTLTAPSDGVVQQLRIFTVGGVVKETQDLLNIAQGEDGLELEVVIKNQDIGFVHEGQPVTVKVETFPFTKYGTLSGSVRFVARDAVSDQDKGLIYTGRIKLNPIPAEGAGSGISLQQGMSVMAEIRTGERQVYEYFLSPILQARQESMRER